MAYRHSPDIHPLLAVAAGMAVVSAVSRPGSMMMESRGPPAERANEVMSLYRDITATAPDELTCLLVLRRAPPAPFIPQEFHGKPIAAIAAHWTGEPDAGVAAMGPIKSFGTPVADTITSKDFAAFQTSLDGGQPFGRRYYWKSDEAGAVSDGLMSALARAAGKITSPFSAILVMHMGGAAARISADATAVGIRHARYAIVIQGAWQDRADDTEHIGWARQSHTDVKPFASGTPYVNFLTEDDAAAQLRGAYAPALFERLRQVKRIYDPENLLRGHLNIPPAA